MTGRELGPKCVMLASTEVLLAKTFEEVVLPSAIFVSLCGSICPWQTF